MDVKGHNVALFAAGTIGEQVVTAGSQLTDAQILLKKQRALDVASVNYDNSTFEVAQSNWWRMAIWPARRVYPHDRF